MKIIARGILFGAKKTVDCEINSNQITFLFDGKKDSYEEGAVRELMRLRKAIGGTYYPQTNSALNVYNVLSKYYFDKLISIKCDEPLDEIPFEKGRIY